jgi:hypothetical protein
MRVGRGIKMVSAGNALKIMIVALLVFGGVVLLISLVFPDAFGDLGLLNPLNWFNVLLGKQQHAVTVIAARGVLLSGLPGWIVGTNLINILTCQDISVGAFLDLPLDAQPANDPGWIAPFTTGALTVWQAKIFDQTGSEVTMLGGSGHRGCDAATLVWRKTVWLSPGSYRMILKWSNAVFNFDDVNVPSSEASFTIAESG